MDIIQKLKEYITRKKENKFLISNVNINVIEGFFDQIKDIICIADYNGKIEYINNGQVYNKYKMLKEVLLYDQNNEMVYEEIISKTIDEGEFIGNIDLNKDDTKVNIYVASYNMTSQRRIFIYIKDLNEYFEKELQLQKEIEKKDEYLRTKDLFIANLSHEIRTPINIIVGMLYFLKSTELDDTQIEYISKLEQASNLLLEMVNNILDLSKGKESIITNNKVNFNLKAFLDNLYNLFEEKAKEKNLQWYITCDFDTDIDIYADKTRMGQVFLNLINNAIKYTEKGYIELLGKKVEENSFSYKLQFCVKDTGIGIKREDTLKIFAEFEQVNEPTIKEKEGSGMGLAITKKIIENMDGKIWVESNVDLGSKFYFNIVVDKSTMQTKEKEEKPTMQEINQEKTKQLLQESMLLFHETKEKHNLQETNSLEDIQNDFSNQIILVVEDNEINQEITKKLIEEMGIVCETVLDGTECLKRIEEVGKEYYSLILMDIHMPKHNGYEISRILKDNMGVDIPIIALTATNITQEVVEQNREYITSYIQKPIMPLEFKKKIKELLQNTRKLENQLSFIDSYEEVMERLGNSEEMLKKLLNIFYNTYININKDMANLKDKDEKYIYIHSLKGAMGNLGSHTMFQRLGELEVRIKNGTEKKELENFLTDFQYLLKELRESSYIKQGIKKILLISDNREKREKQKKLLYPYFEVITTQKESDAYLLLDAYSIDAILVYELENIEQEIALIKDLKNKDRYKDIPLLLINEEKNPLLKAKALEINIDEYMEVEFEVDNIKWHIDNAIQKKQDELKLKKDLKKSNSEIENVYDFLYSSLVHLTAYKSKETGAHLLRTKEYMKRMLKEYENFYHEGQFVQEKTIEDIAIAATLHDIGKVGIPDNILNKPGKLTEEEYEIIKQHVIIGRDTLEGTYGNKLSNNVLQYAKDIVYHHHEKFDGTGYPEGLKNDEITTICKVMAVIDVYDALVNDRVYKKAMPYEEAEKYIIEQSGKAFDPKVINIFRIVKSDLRKINEENQDK